MQTVFLFGPLAQLGERQVRNLEVRGSIPLWSTKRAPHRLGDGVLFWWIIRVLERDPPSAVAVPNVRGAMIPPVLMRTAADIRRNECAVVLRKKFDPCLPHILDHLRFGERTPSAVAVPNMRGAMIPPVLMRTVADIRRNECAVELRKKFDPCLPHILVQIPLWSTKRAPHRLGDGVLFWRSVPPTGIPGFTPSVPLASSVPSHPCSSSPEICKILSRQ